MFRMLWLQRMIVLPGNGALRGREFCPEAACAPPPIGRAQRAVGGHGGHRRSALALPVSSQCSTLVALRDCTAAMAAPRGTVCARAGYDMIVSYSSGKETRFAAGQAGNNESGTVTSANGCCAQRETAGFQPREGDIGVI